MTNTLDIQDAQFQTIIGYFDKAAVAQSASRAVPSGDSYTSLSATIASFSETVQYARSALSDASRQAATSSREILSQLSQTDQELANEAKQE